MKFEKRLVQRVSKQGCSMLVFPPVMSGNLYFGFFMIVKQSLECEAPASLWIPDKT